MTLFCMNHVSSITLRQPINGRMMQHIPCDLDYTLFNGTGAPIVTSPHELRL